MAGTEFHDDIGTGYSLGRRTDPRWMTAILAAPGTARSIADVGTGTGSYEPDDRRVFAIEPSIAMIRQRPRNAGPAVRAVAESLPIRNHAVDAALAVLTVHTGPTGEQGSPGFAGQRHTKSSSPTTRI
ncbi:class I SAM-dependent methyltransferase [Saccharopolyspora shandongensis]|uniref:class I SAM-dependent methyltransferase n=1 Tax=Saccharopolyspora shandongensis TaxID=418495 RepID=UPI003404805C